MAKRLIKFDGEEYSIEETKFDPTISRLAQFLTDELAGTGVNIRLGGKIYSVDGERVSTATDGFTSYLESIEGDDVNVKVGGTTYGLSRADVEDGYEMTHEVLRGMADGDEPDEPELPASEGLEYRLNDDGQSYSVTGIGTCEDIDLIIPDMYEGLPITKIGDWAFSSCTGLTSIEMPNSVTSIGEGAFCDCSKLTNIIIPDSVTKIGESAFEYCTNLQNISIGNGITRIGAYAFQYTACTGYYSGSIWYPTEKYIGNCLIAIDRYQRYYNIRNGTKVVADRLFPYHSDDLTTITIPESLINIGEDTFNECKNLTSIVVDENNSVYKSIDGDLYTKDGKTLVRCATGKSGNFEISESVEHINTKAFSNCSKLTNIIIPTSMTKIEDYAFYGCGGSMNITIPNSVTSIGVGAFAGSSLNSIIIPNSVEHIDDSALSWCNRLRTVRIGNGIKNISSSAFAYCEDPMDIYIDAPENSIANAPWGGWNVTIHWNTPLPTHDDA